jgi:urease subunit beta
VEGPGQFKSLLNFLKHKVTILVNLSNAQHTKISSMIPGEYILAADDIEINAGRKTATVTVVNTGDRPVQVGSHFHFFEINRQMSFDREKAFGMRLNIAAGTAVRFEPGEENEVELVAFGGKKKITGFNNLTNGKIKSADCKSKAAIKSYLLHFKNNSE